MIQQRILMIDDEIDYCRIMQSYFTRKNYAVTVAYTLKDGLALLESETPDILFLDNNLPDGKGWSHVESIVEKNPQMKIFLVSAYQQEINFSNLSTVTVWEKPLSLALLNSNFLDGNSAKG